MQILFRKSKRILLGLILVAVAGGAIMFFRPGGYAGKLETVPVSFEHQSVKNKALIYLFLDKLQEQSDLFYEPYYTINPTIAHYMTSVKDIEEKGAQINITFSTLPYIGPHDTIGEDEITFSINYSGEIALVDFRHLKSDSLPDHLKSIEKGVLPPIRK